MLRTLFVLLVFGVGAAYAASSAFYALLLYLWVAYFRPETWVWYDFVSSLKPSFIIGAYVLAISPFVRERLRFDFRKALLIAFLLHALASTVLSDRYDAAWLNWLDLAKAVAISYVIAVLVCDRKRYRQVLVTIALSLGCEAAKQGWASLVLHPGAKNDNVSPFLGDNNGVALGVLMLVPVVVALARTANSKWERYFFQFLAAGLTYRAITTYSRGGFLALGALGIMYALRSPRRLRTLAVMCVLAVMIVPVLPSSFWDRMSTITASEDDQDTSAAGRVHFWRVAIQMGEDSPLVGVGPGAYNASYDKYDFLNGVYGRSRAVHSVWFGVFAELGYVGFALFLTILLFAFLASRRARLIAARDPTATDLYHYAVALETGLVVFMIGGTFLAWQYGEMLWHFIGLSSALYAITQQVAQTRVSAPAYESDFESIAFRAERRVG